MERNFIVHSVARWLQYILGMVRLCKQTSEIGFINFKQFLLCFVGFCEVFVIVSGSDGRTGERAETLLEPAK